MQDMELKILLQNAGKVPQAPTDRFVAAFQAQMDADLVVKQKPSFVQNWAYGAIAACAVFAFGTFFALQNDFFAPNKNDGIVETASNYQTDADAFAAQLLSDDYVADVAVSNDL